MDELDKLNQKYEEMSIGIFPFISRNRVTPLKKGFYQKKNATYRGISFIFDKKQGRSKAILIGYYYVPEDYIIVPHGLTVTDGKRKLIADKLNDGYIITTDFPSLKPFEFLENSEEFYTAQLVNQQYKEQSRL